MKQLKAILLSLLMLSAFALAAAGQGETPLTAAPAGSDSLPPPSQPGSVYVSFTGKVKTVAEYSPIEGALIALLEDGQGGEANFIITADTYVVDHAAIEPGANLIGFYDAGKPMILIYPPQFNVEVVAEAKADQFIKVGLFDDELISADGDLRLNLSDETQITDRDGAPFAGEIAGKKLIVFYTFTTRSIPAQTTPSRIIVLDGAEADIKTSAEPELLLSVNGVLIEDPMPFADEDGTLMIPLRAVSEALGFTVMWHEADYSVTLDETVSLSIGSPIYQNGENQKELEAAAVLREDRTFVPLSFFREVLMIEDADAADGYIIIESK